MAIATFTPTSDTTVSSLFPNAVYNDDPVLSIGYTQAFKAFRSILHFNLSSLKGVLVQNASLRLYVDLLDDYAAQCYARRVTQSNLNFTYVSWKYYNFNMLWTTQGGDYTTTDESSWTLPTTQEYVDIDMSLLVADALKYRNNQLLTILMRSPEQTPDALVDFYSKEGESNDPYNPYQYVAPTLTIEYT